MTDPDVFTPAAWDREMPDPPFRSRGLRIGAHAGASELGATLFELDPGGMTSPYHLHHGNEELLIVLAGRPELRTPDGLRTLEPGAVVAFPRGAAGAHRVANRGDEPVRVLIVSTMHHPELAEYPDTGATLTLTGPGEGKVFPAGGEIPYVEAIVRAAQADAEAT